MAGGVLLRRGTTRMQVMVVDDDEVSREVLKLLLEAEGYAVETAVSGEEAYTRLLEMTTRPDVVLTDMQMPGMSGRELMRELRAACGDTTKVLAMSADAVDLLDGFDGFLRKPFGMEDLIAAMGGVRASSVKTPGAEVLDRAIYAKFAAKMRHEQLMELYEICLRDVEMRVAKMQEAAAKHDGAAVRREAHAIRGGCGMVGAVELQKLASVWEERDYYGDDVASFDEFLPACERVRRMLVGHKSSQSRSMETQGEDSR